MRLSREMATAFGDWLELDRIRRALLAARPLLVGTLVLDEERPLLRVPRSTGEAVIVARIDEAGATPWVVGVPGDRPPVLLDAGTPDEVVMLVLQALGDPASSETATAP